MRVNKRQIQLLPRHPIGTMAGFGWLREAPRPAHVPPAAKLSPTEVAKHAALRKCIYFPAMDPSMASAVARAAERVRTNPDLFRPPLRKRNTPPGSQLVSGRGDHARGDHARGDHARGDHARGGDPRTYAAAHRGSPRWPSLEDPVSVGILLAVVPPVGFMMLWGSSRYSRDAKIAITALMTVFMVLGTAALCTALLVLR